jgi:ribosomal-protein-alanine N-acetyltransferase
MHPDNKYLNIHIRWMIRRDMPEVIQIEQGSFESPWSEEDFLKCLRQRNCIGMVAESQERVLGFMIYELHKERLEVLNMAVHPGYRNRWIGVQMVNKLKSKLSNHRRTEISLCLRETNLTAQKFFRSQKFLAVDVHRNFYEDTGEDAFEMVYGFDAEPIVRCGAGLKKERVL